MWTVAAFYRFVDLTGRREALQATLKALKDEHGLCGIILVADEGINGTIAAPTQNGVQAALDVLSAEAGLPMDEVKWSTASVQPFFKYKVRLKKEIITMKAPEADPTKRVGDYVTAEDWNALVTRDDVILLDTRNRYETEIGTFKGAVDPDIQHFTHFKDFVANMPEEAKHKKIAMFCTGGIRCEKASAYMLAQGFPEVYHLKGGILKYLETVPADQSLWQGGCFVFDKRVALEHGLEEAII